MAQDKTVRNLNIEGRADKSGSDHALIILNNAQSASLSAGSRHTITWNGIVENRGFTFDGQNITIPRTSYYRVEYGVRFNAPTGGDACNAALRSESSGDFMRQTVAAPSNSNEDTHFSAAKVGQMQEGEVRYLAVQNKDSSDQLPSDDASVYLMIEETEW